MKIKNLILLTFFLCFFAAANNPALCGEKTYAHEPPDRIVVEKRKFVLTLYREGKEVLSFPVAVGRNKGNKQRVGDLRTPVGTFMVERIHDSSHWVHDFKDGKGPIKGAYGPWFIRLKTGWSGIGIHGTHDPGSIGQRATEGCVRLRNDHLELLVKHVEPGLVVVIEE